MSGVRLFFKVKEQDGKLSKFVGKKNSSIVDVLVANYSSFKARYHDSLKV